MALERTYNIPLRKEFLKVPKYRRAKKSMTGVRAFLVKNMKSNNILLGPKLNMAIWANGARNPPHHVKVKVLKDEKGEVRAELFGFDFQKKVKQEKVETKSGLAGKIQEKMASLKPEDKKPQPAETPQPAEKPKPAEKPEAKPAEKPAEKPEAKPTEKPKPADEPKPAENADRPKEKPAVP